MRDSTARSVSVTRSTAVFGSEGVGWLVTCCVVISCLSSLLIVFVKRERYYIQFFFDPDSDVVGLAATMRSPASLAMEIIKSWISLRLRSAILLPELTGGGGEEGERKVMMAGGKYRKLL
jgi:hypothetical protein